MKRIPQIRLRTIFAIFVCAAVGLTVGTVTKSEGGFTDVFLGVSTLQLNLPYAFLWAVLTAFIIGLLGQVRLLMQSSLQGGALIDGFRWARAFAISWRLLLSAILIACLIAEILIARKVISLPYDVYYLIKELFPTLVWMLCLIVVVGVSVSRWTKKKVKPPRHPFVTITMWLAGVILVLIILPQPLQIQYLVHLATAGVERAMPGEFQRAGTFPDHQREGFRTFWMALAASVSIVVATASLITLNRVRSPGLWPRIALATTFLVTWASAAAYSVWYYSAEFHRVSPDLASAPLEAEWHHWLAGGMLLVIAVTVGAYRLTCRDEEYTLLENRREGQQGQIALYETAGCLFIVALALLIHAIESVRAFWYSVSSIGLSPSDVAMYVVKDFSGYFVLAIYFLTVRFCWLRWRRRKEVVPWTLAAVDGKRFAWNWLALALIAIVGVPTLSAFSFVFWLGPWWLIGP